RSQEGVAEPLTQASAPLDLQLPSSSTIPSREMPGPQQVAEASAYLPRVLQRCGTTSLPTTRPDPREGASRWSTTPTHPLSRTSLRAMRRLRAAASIGWSLQEAEDPF